MNETLITLYLLKSANHSMMVGLEFSELNSEGPGVVAFRFLVVSRSTPCPGNRTTVPGSLRQGRLEAPEPSHVRLGNSQMILSLAWSDKAMARLLSESESAA